MKKTALVWLLALSMALFVGCGKDDENVDAPVDPQQIENQQPDANNANQPTDAPAPTDNTVTDTQNDSQNADQTNADVTDGADVNDANAPTDKE